MQKKYIIEFFKYIENSNIMLKEFQKIHMNFLIY